MKKLFTLFTVLTIALTLVALCACNTTGGFLNPGDSLGGGGTASYTPQSSQETSSAEIAESVGTISQGESEVPDGATHITGKYTISSAGDYYVDSTIEGKKITVSAEGAVLYLKGATLSNEKKVIESSVSFTITLIGENSITNTDTDEQKTAITCDGTLTINGNGSLDITSINNGISADSIIISGASVSVNAQKDGLHAEISAYDDSTSEPTFSYDNGYVYVENSTLTINSASDGIQADTFVYIKNSNINITTNGGAPTTITETSSDNGEGKGIKAGTIDWGSNDTEIEEADYLIYIESGNFTINANDDAIHSNGELTIMGGTFSITTGDDGIHANELVNIEGGEITIPKCYEGIEGAKVEIYGGTISVTSTDDGLNAADGTTTQVNVANNNCHLIIAGGTINVNASGDGIDSNGSMLINGGTVFVSGSTSGADAAMDADGSIIVNGGTLFACGALGMVETPASNSAQNCVSFAKSSSISAGTILTLVDSSSNEIVSYTVPKSCQSVIISSPQLTTGGTYQIYGGDTSLCSFTVSQTITTVGSSTSSSNPFNKPNRW